MSEHVDVVRAAWLWASGDLTERGEVLLDFTCAKGLNRIFLHLSAGVPPAVYADFLALAQSRAVRVEALCGDPAWSRDPAHREVRAFIERVAKINSTLPPPSRFCAAHLDLEPYRLPEWRTDQPATQRRWLQTVEQFLVAARDAGLSPVLDVPFWLDRLPPVRGAAFSANILECSDLAVIMAYRTRLWGANGIAALAAPLLRRAAACGRSALVAVDTSGRGEPGTSFQSASDLDACLRNFPDAFCSCPAYGGYAVHALGRWINLPTAPV